MKLWRDVGQNIELFNESEADFKCMLSATLSIYVVGKISAETQIDTDMSFRTSNYLSRNAQIIKLSILEWAE